ncbi:HNH endonuclease signature motif containing protein [Microbacterium saperdae]
MAALMDVTGEQMATLDELVDLLQSVERTISSLQAARDGILALGSRWAVEVADQAQHPDGADMAARSVAAEMATALRMSERTIQRRMAEADWLVTRFPLVWAAQGAGRISAAHARVIVDAAEHLDAAEDRDAYSVQILELAEAESPNRVARMARRVAERFQPRSLDERHRYAREQRGVWVRDVADGMAQLGLRGPAALVHGVFDRLTGMGEVVQTACAADHDAPRSAELDAPAAVGDGRTVDQLRADLALDLLLTGAPAGNDGSAGVLGAISAHVSVTIPVLTLSGRDDVAAELDGSGPIDIETARRLAGAASGWDRVLTDPVDGSVLAVDRYRPSAQLRRHLRARDQRCRFPGCGRSPSESDVDHTHDAALGGATREDNLAHLCRRHHMLKHHTPWQVERLDGGVLSWTSPAGRTYVDRPQPPNTVTFRDSIAPPF